MWIGPGSSSPRRRARVVAHVGEGGVGAALLEGAEFFAGGVVAVGEVDHVFEFARGAGEPVEVPHDHGIDLPGPDVGEQAFPCGTWLARVRRDVVVDVDLDDRPSAPLGERAAVLFLACDAEPGAFAVLGDADVDRYPNYGSHIDRLVGTGLACPVGVAPAEG